MKKRYRYSSWFLFVVILAILAGPLACKPATAPTTNTNNTPSQTFSDAAAGSQTDFVFAVQKVIPSVVKIEVQYSQQQNPSSSGGATSGAGTGWVIDKGLIVTNYHVIANAQTVAVVLNDGTQFTPTAVQYNSTKDLAVLKINNQSLAPVSIGDSQKLMLGQPVAAVGNALDLGIRVTTGVISLLNVSINSPNIQYTGLIETDATINPGNSGGVLITAKGEVVGITNAGLQDPTVDPENFGYAININEALPVIKSLISQMP